MNFKLLKDLWKYTALPIVLFLGVIIALVSYLQVNAVRIQSEPIVIDISGTNLVSIEETGIAEEVLEPAVILSDSTDPWFALKVLIENGKYSEAETLIQESAKNNGMLKGDNTFQIIHVQLLVKMEESDKALNILDSLDTETGKGKQIQFYRGLILNRLGDKKGAIEAYKAALEFEPNYYEAALNLGSIYLSAGRIDQAITILESAIKMAGGKRRSRTLTILGRAYNQAGFFNKGEISLLEAINLSPADLKSRNELGSLYFNAEELEKAIDIYNEILLLDAYYGDAYKGLAKIKVGEGKFSDAEVLLEKALRVIPYYDEGRRMLADIFFKSGRNSEARTQLFWILENGKDISGASFQLGQLNYNEKNYAKAGEYYEKAYSASGNTNLESLNNLALALKAQGKTDEAELILLKAVETDGTYSRAYYNLGLIYLDKDEPQLALNAFKTVIALNPLHEQSWYNIGYIHSQRGAVKAAVSAYEEALNINPANVKSRLNLAVQYKKDGKLELAEKQYNLVLSINPSYASAWYNLALLLKQKNDFEESEKAYQRAVDLDPENSKYRSGLSLLYSIQGRGAESLEILKEALDISPDDEYLRYKLAKQLEKNGEINEAIEQYQKLLALNESYTKGWLGLASIQMDQKKYTDASASYKKVIETNPEDAYTKYLLGKTLYSLENYKEAVAYYNKALETIKDNSWIWYNLGKVQQKLGDTRAADISFNKSISINPGMGKYIVGKLEYTNDSLELLESMILDDPGNYILYIQIAQIYYREGANEKALKALRSVVDLNPDDPEVWILLAETAMKGNDNLLAETAFRNAGKLNPADGNVSFALALLIKYRGDNVEAVRELNSALLLMDDQLPGLIKLGELYYEIRDYLKSVETLRKAAELSPLDSTILYDLGKAYYRNKQYRESLRVFKKSISFRGDYAWGYIWLGRTYSRLRSFNEAELQFRKSMEIDPHFIQSYISLGDLALLTDNAGGAINFYRKALEIDPLHASTRRKLDKLEG